MEFISKGIFRKYSKVKILVLIYIYIYVCVYVYIHIGGLMGYIYLGGLMGNENVVKKLFMKDITVIKYCVGSG